ncbi:uncharacterized protein [Apostichopus japonicus]|uniref:uncharacterized protein isoform X1 n=1 Tax=Stichopus japonicus TaxID=307972 RepID=UPI003AB457B4
MGKTKSLSSITANGETFFLFTTTIAEEEDNVVSFELVLTDAINAWSGSISNSDLQALCKEIKEDLSKFIEESKEALTQTDDGSNLVFGYQVKSLRDGCKELAWKRVMQDENIKFQLGSVRLQPADDPSEHMRELLQHSIEEVAASQKKMKHLECEQDRLSSERAQALKRLEKCVEMKEEQDKNLYSKFCVVLNEKKSKIRKLQENRLDSDLDSVDKVEPASVKSEDDDSVRGSEEMEAADGDGGDDDDVGTDEENEKNTVSKGRKMKRRLKDEDEDNSLILDEEEEEKPSTSHGRRRKRKPAHKPAVSTSKPSIPRVPSTPKNGSAPSSLTTRSGRTASLRKTPSSGTTRRGRSGEQDASDLFDEM